MIAAVVAGLFIAGAMWFPARNADRLDASGACVIGDQL